MNIGERILAEIIKQQMFVVADPDPQVSHVFVWSSGAAEQLEALVNEAFLEQIGLIGPFENPDSQKPIEPAETWLQERANWMIAIRLLESERDQLRAKVERLNTADSFSKRELARGNEIIDGLRQELDQLRARVADLEKDKARLDWLDSYDSDLYWNDYANPGQRGELRARIDAAREGRT